MPKKKQITFQTSIPGKFIPRNTPLPGSVFPSRANDNRFNAKMAELLASSSIVNDENELFSASSSEDHPISTEIISIDSSHIHSRLFHRRIVTMIESIKKTSDDPSAISSTPSQPQYKSQPITFGQLRKATTSSVSTQVIEDKTSHQKQADADEKHDKILTSSIKDNDSNVTSATSKSPTKRQANKERFYYSPSLAQLIEEKNVVMPTKKEDEQVQKSSLTVDEILAMYYSKIQLSTETESKLSSSNGSTNSSGNNFYSRSSVTQWSSTQNHQPNIHPSQMFNQRKRNRPPPPSYESSIANSHRTASAVMNSLQQPIRPSASSPLLEHVYPGAPVSQHLSTGNPSLILPNSSSALDSTMNIQLSNDSIGHSLPGYQSPNPTIKRFHSTLSSINDASTSSQQIKTVHNNANTSAGFDREFSRLLYGKDARKTRRQKYKRKAFSDPVKKSVEEALRSIEKNRRRVTCYVNKTEVVHETEEDESDYAIISERRRSEVRKQELSFLSRRRLQRQANLTEAKREPMKGTLVPANSSLKQRIPSFLRIYSQASSSNDILLQWHLFNLSELEALNAMMSRLYKNENLARVQLYETYRTVLLSTLTAKTSLNTTIENTAITAAV